MSQYCQNCKHFRPNVVLGCCYRLMFWYAGYTRHACHNPYNNGYTMGLLTYTPQKREIYESGEHKIALIPKNLYCNPNHCKNYKNR